MKEEKKLTAIRNDEMIEKKRTQAKKSDRARKKKKNEKKERETIISKTRSNSLKDCNEHIYIHTTIRFSFGTCFFFIFFSEKNI